MDYDQASAWIQERERITIMLEFANLTRDKDLYAAIRAMQERHSNPDMLYSWQQPQELIPLEP